MQDAIQGMLCMSQGGSLSLSTSSPPGHSTLGWTSPGRTVKPPTPRKYIYDDDGIDKMPTCYKDDEFGKLHSHHSCVHSVLMGN